ncbi:MAG: hypothetical protein Q7T55_26380, partial [Solirubrobacteraceae bacterium]|nr:hypothetical protein [Solirubrobacteraceae bacterium]
MRRSSHGAALAALTLALASGASDAAAAGDPIMPLAEVQPGMQCFGSTVVSGIDPVTFDATVISVEGGPKPTDATIAMRYSGPVVENGGIAAGYSGSPVRCPRADGTYGIIGAVAYGIGQYDNLIGLVTPIEAMLGMPVSADAPAAPVIGVSAPDRDAVQARTKSTAKGKKAKAADSTTSTKKPASTPAPAVSKTTGLRTELPLTLTGPKGALASTFVKAAAAGGQTLLVAPAATRSQAVAAPVLRPG